MRILVVSQYYWPDSFRINELVDKITIFIAPPKYHCINHFLGVVLEERLTAHRNNLVPECLIAVVCIADFQDHPVPLDA